jgi:hypothetical protein
LKKETKKTKLLLVSDKFDAKTQEMIRDEVRKYIMINGTILHDKTIPKVYEPKNSVSVDVRQKLTEVTRERKKNSS